MIITVVIVNWNTCDELCACLESLRDEGAAVIVVDNASDDGSADRVASTFPDVRVIRAVKNLGYSAGNNLVLDQIQTPYVLFLNPDTRVRKGSIRVLATFLQEHPDYGAAGPVIRLADGSIDALSGRGHYTLWDSVCDALCLDRLLPSSPFFNRKMMPTMDKSVSQDVECLTGCALMMPTDLFRSLQGFDETVPLYLDDCDLSRRMTDRGLKLRLCADAEVYHGHDASGSQVAYGWKIAVSREGHYVYLLTHNGRLAAELYRVLTALSGLARSLLLAVPAILLPRLRRHLAIAWHHLRWATQYAGSDWVRTCPQKRRRA